MTTACPEDCRLRFSSDHTRAIVPNGLGYDCCAVAWNTSGSHYVLTFVGLTAGKTLAEQWLATGKVE